MLVGPMDLLLPAALSALLAWFASAAIHMVFKYHDSDYKKIDNEDEIAAAVRKAAPNRGVHPIPYCVDMKQMADPEMQRRFNDGPVAFITVFANGMPRMGPLLGQQILYFFVGAFLVGYSASLALGPGAAYLDVFRMVSSIGFLAFFWGMLPFKIWYGLTAGTAFKYGTDGLIYALLTAGVYAWLWPEAIPA